MSGPATGAEPSKHGIIARLISRTGLDLVTSRMFAPSEELTKRYADTIVTETDPRHRATQELIRDYVLKNFTGTGNALANVLTAGDGGSMLRASRSSLTRPPPPSAPISTRRATLSSRAPCRPSMPADRQAAFPSSVSSQTLLG